MNLELIAMRWLIYEKKCEYALFERSPRAIFCGEPDVLGITKDRHLVEIEIKRTLSDFKQDRIKRSRNPIIRDMYIDRFPRQFYYLVPSELENKVAAEVPEWSGLMKCSHAIEIVRRAPINFKAKRLSVKECLKMVRSMANHSFSVLQKYQSAIARFQEGEWSWPEPMYEI